jgi:hypothetical protein
VLYRLEAVRTPEDARDAADALRALLEAEDLLVIQTINQADRSASGAHKPGKSLERQRSPHWISTGPSASSGLPSGCIG